MRVLSCALAALVLAGCATAYQPHGLSGGFDEIRLAENSYRVSFRGNGYTSANRAEEMTLLRSSELCLEGGFRYFVIVDGRTSIRQEGWTTPVQVGFTRRGLYAYGGESYNFSMPSTNNTIMCFDAKPERVMSFDARTLYFELANRYQVPMSPKVAEAQRRSNEAREARLSEAERNPPVAAAAIEPSAGQALRKTGKDTYQAESLAKGRSCSAQPIATLAASGAGFETYSVPCTNGDTIAIRCEFGNCRVLQ